MSRLTLRDLGFLATTAPATAAASVVTSGLQLYVDAGNTSSYPGTGTTWTDLSGNNRTCTLTGGPTYSSANGGSFYFNGPNSGQYAQMSGSISSLTAATFFAFVRRDGALLNYNGIIFSRGSGSASGMNTRDTVGTSIGYHWNNSEAGFGNLQIPNTTWCMVAVTFGSATATGYLGTSSGITSQSTSQTTSSTNLDDVEIAGNQTFADRYFKGNISVAMIYNRALSASEIAQNFSVFMSRYGYSQSGNSIVLNGLVVHLDAGNSASYSGSGTTWTDLSGNGNNATLIGSPSFTASPGFFDITSDSTYVRLNKYSHGANDFTYTLWVNFDTNKTWNTLVENGNWSDSLLIRAQFGLQLAVYAKGTEIGNRSWTPSTGTWYNVAYTRSGSTNTLYINGSQLGATFTDQTNMTFADQYMFLMRSQHTGDQYVDGKFAQFAIYSRALSASEITQNFDALKTRYGY